MLRRRRSIAPRLSLRHGPCPRGRRRRRRAAELAAAAAVAALSLAPAAVLAQTATWTNAAGGTFSTAANWSGSTLPGTTATALFNLTGTYPVTFANSPTNTALNVYGGNVTFQTNGTARTYALTSDAVVYNATLTLAGATPLLLTASAVNVIGGGTLNVTQGSDVTSSGYTSIGYTGGSGTVNVTGSGSTFVTNGTAFQSYLGRSGHAGTLSVSSSASATIAGGLDIGYGAGSTGTLSVASGASVTLGPTSIATNTAGGTGSITLADSASTLTMSGASALTVGAASGSTASFTQSAGTFNSSTGTLTVNKTGTANLNGGTFNLNGNLAVAGGTLTQGSASTFAAAAGKTISVASGGKLNLYAGQLPASTSLSVTGAASQFAVTGGASTLYVDAGSTVSIGSGGQWKPSFLFLGSGPSVSTAATSATVDGAGSTLTAGGTYGGFASRIGTGSKPASLTFQNSAAGSFVHPLKVGNDSSAANALTVQSGATLAAADLLVGAVNATGAAAVTVTGTGSSLTQADAASLTVGQSDGAGTASVTIASAGTLTTGTGATTINRTGTVVFDNATFAPKGDVTVDGGLLRQAGSGGALYWPAGKTLTVTNGGTVDLGGWFRFPSAATVNVTAGGRLSTVQWFNLGYHGNSTLAVDGAGSSLSSGYLTDLTPAAGGTTSLTFSNGATGSLAGLKVGSDKATATGTVTVQSGAAVTVPGDITVGATTASGQTASVMITGAGSALTQTASASLTIGASADAGTGLGQAAIYATSGASFTTGTGPITINKTGRLDFDTASATLNGNIAVAGGTLATYAGTFITAPGKSLNVTAGGLGRFWSNWVVPSGTAVSVSDLGSEIRIDGIGWVTFDAGSALSVSGGATFNTNMLSLGKSGSIAVGTASATVDGPGSALTAYSRSYVGDEGHAAVLTFSNAATGSFTNAIEVGNHLNGSTVAEMRVLSGAKVTTAGLAVGTHGSAATGGAYLSVGGAGSSLTQTTGRLDVGSSAAGATPASVEVSAGATLTTAADAAFAYVARSGTLTVSGGTLNLNSYLSLEGSFNHTSGTFNWSPGTTPTALYMYPGSRFATAAPLTFPAGKAGLMYGGALSAPSLTLPKGTALSLSSGDARLTTAGELSVGSAGAEPATLALSGGASAAAASLRVASTTDNVPATGIVTVSDGSSLSVSGEVRIGFTSVAGRSASVTVSGPGSTLTNDGPDGFIGLGYLGSSTGSLTVKDGATLAAHTLDLYRSGTLSIAGGSVSLAALWADGGTLAFTAGSLTVGTTFTFGPAGHIASDFTLTPNHRLSVGTTTTIAPFTTLTLAGGSLSTGSLANNGTLAFTAGTLSITNSNVSFGAAGPFGANYVLAPDCTLNLTKPATVAAAGLLVLNGSTLNAFDGLTNSGELRLLGPLPRVAGSTLTNHKLLTGAGYVDASLANSSTGEVRVDAGSRLTFAGPSHSNAGALNLSGTAEFAGALANTGRINLTSGALVLGTASTNAGTISGRGTVSAPSLTNAGTIQFTTGLTDVFAPLTNNAGARVIVTGTGSATFYSPVTLAAGSELRVSAGSTAVFLAPLTGQGSVTGAGAKYFEAGASEPAALATGGDTVVYGSASLTTAYLAESSLTAYGPVALLPGSPASTLASLTILDGAAVDLADNDLTLTATPAATVRGYLLAGSLTSSTPDPRDVLSVGYTPDGSSLLVRPTYTGDADLDGAVDADDYLLLDRGLALALPSPGWRNGDFNYDDFVTAQDYLLIDRTFVLQGAPLSPTFLADRESRFGPAYVSSLVAVVPEPGTLSLLTLAAPLATRRRRCRYP